METAHYRSARAQLQRLLRVKTFCFAMTYCNIRVQPRSSAPSPVLRTPSPPRRAGERDGERGAFGDFSVGRANNFRRHEKSGAFLMEWCLTLLRSEWGMDDTQPAPSAPVLRTPSPPLGAGEREGERGHVRRLLSRSQAMGSMKQPQSTRHQKSGAHPSFGHPLPRPERGRGTGRGGTFEDFSVGEGSMKQLQSTRHEKRGASIRC
jgi:hypothetical protein